MPNATNSQLDTVESLLASERSIASMWWTILNEMRLHKQLPDWVLKMEGPVGSHAQMDVLGDIQRKTDIALSGLPAEYEYLVWDEKRNTLAGAFSSIREADKAAARLRSQYPKARVVRLHHLSDDQFTIIRRIDHA
jgi:hypothetical protein